MALGIPTSSGGSTGEIKARIEYDARAGRFFKVDRSQDAAGNWSGTKSEIPLPFKLAIDMATIRVGWLKFANGVDFKLVKIGEPYPAKPEGTDDKGKSLYKGGFQLDVYNDKLGQRVWSHTAKCVVDNIDGLHNAFAAHAAANPGKWPIVEFRSVVPVASGQSTNYAPVMAIVDWYEPGAPAAAPANGNGAHAAPAAQTPAQQPAYVPPPVQQQPAAAAGGNQF